MLWGPLRSPGMHAWETLKHLLLLLQIIPILALETLLAIVLIASWDILVAGIRIIVALRFLLIILPLILRLAELGIKGEHRIRKVWRSKR